MQDPEYTLPPGPLGVRDDLVGLRDASGLTVRQFAAKHGFGRHLVEGVERGNVPLPALRPRLAEAYGAPAGSFRMPLAASPTQTETDA